VSPDFGIGSQINRSPSQLIIAFVVQAYVNANRGFGMFWLFSLEFQTLIRRMNYNFCLSAFNQCTKLL
jgi:hypothetical protein